MTTVVITNSGNAALQVNDKALPAGACGGFMTPVTIVSAGGVGYCFVTCCEDPPILTGNFIEEEYTDENGYTLTREVEETIPAEPVSVTIQAGELEVQVNQNERYPASSSIIFDGTLTVV